MFGEGFGVREGRVAGKAILESGRKLAKGNGGSLLPMEGRFGAIEEAENVMARQNKVDAEVGEQEDEKEDEKEDEE